MKKMSSFFKSFAGNPREAAAMAMVQSSSYRVCDIFIRIKPSFFFPFIAFVLGTEQVIDFLSSSVF